MIEFGGFIFGLVVLAFLVVQGILLYSERNWQSILAVVLFGVAAYFTVTDWPAFNYKFLMIYPVLAALWMPVYWYLDFARRASEIKAGILRCGSLSKYVGSVNHTGRNKDIEKNRDGEYYIDLKHPSKDDLFANTLAFPVSIPLFFGENFIRMGIDYMTQWMENTRQRFNKAINEYIKGV
jgi:hypothetical protein